MPAIWLWDGDTRRRITDVETALRFLHDLWPEGFAYTAHYQQAVGAAPDVIETGAPVDAFRAALLAAAEEADILSEPHAALVLPQPLASVSRYLREC